MRKLTGFVSMNPGMPSKQGLYDPRFEHDACGVGFVVDIAGRRSREIVLQALEVLNNLAHRGAKGSEANAGERAPARKPSGGL